MQAPKATFDLVVSYPQWQGSGRAEHLSRGARATADVCREYGPLASVADAGTGTARGGVLRWTAILEQFHSARAILGAARPRRVLTAGGDCACDIAVIDDLHRRYPDLTVLWVDAHFDANTVNTTPSGNFHGMPVASLLGAASAELQALLGEPIAPSRFRYVGAHVADAGDRAFQREKGLAWLAPGERFPGPVHVHFDLDALDPAAFPWVAYPDGTLAIDAAVALLRGVADTLVGLTITEFAPPDEIAARRGAEVVRRLCEAACGR